MSETAVAQLISEFTGIPTYNGRTWWRWTSRDHAHAWAFVQVNTQVEDALIDRAPRIVTDGMSWEAEWCHDSLPALVASTYILTNPEHPALCFHYHNTYSLLRVVSLATGQDLPTAKVHRKSMGKHK